MNTDREILWQLLDDIDTLDDSCKDDDHAFRELVRRVQQRRFHIGESFDGQSITWKNAAADLSESLDEVSASICKLQSQLDRLSDRLAMRIAPPPPAGHPMQAVILDRSGVARFHENALVQYLLKSGPFDLNHIATLPNINREDREQFAQLIGWSVDAFCSFEYVSEDAAEAATKAAAELFEAKENSDG